MSWYIGHYDKYDKYHKYIVPIIAFLHGKEGMQGWKGVCDMYYNIDFILLLRNCESYSITVLY